jgi:hypothetical protein
MGFGWGGSHREYEDGVPVRVTTGRGAEGFDSVTAIRFLQGGFLLVSAAQGVPAATPDTEVLPPDAAATRGPLPGDAPRLDRVPLTARQAAVVAGDPAMLG